jgi:hypothetical protein
VAAHTRNGKPVGLDPQYVGVLPCGSCQVRAMKLPGRESGVCLHLLLRGRACRSRPTGSICRFLDCGHVRHRPLHGMRFEGCGRQRLGVLVRLLRIADRGGPAAKLTSTWET